MPRASSSSWNVAEGALDQTIALLTQGESSAKKRALLVEARRLRSRIASWRAIPPPPATKREAFESAMHLLRKAGEVPPAPPSSTSGFDKPDSSFPPPAPSSGVTPVAQPASSPPSKVPSTAPSAKYASSVPPVIATTPDGPPGPRREVVSPGVTIIRPRAMDYRPFRVLEGVDLKVLHRDDDGLFRAIVRLAPGAEMPRHEHVRAEDLLILEGSLVIDGVTMRAGEFCHAETGSIHDAATAPSGCTFLLVGSEKNKIFWE